MITKWKLFNFKSVRDETELELGPLTILAGPNSSGKSTWTQSMLLISQTLASKVSSRSVVLNGHLAKLGQFDDLRSFNSEADQIVVGWECGPGSPFWGERRDFRNRFSCEISFDVDPSSPRRDILQLQPGLFSCELFISVGSTRRKFDLTISRSIERIGKLRNLDTSDLEEEVPQSVLNYDIKLNSDALREIHRDQPSAEPVGCELGHFLPNRLAVRFNKVQELAEVAMSALYDYGPGPGRQTSTSLPGRRPFRFYPYLRDSLNEFVIPKKVLAMIKVNLLEDSVESAQGSQTKQFTAFFEQTETSSTIDSWYEELNKLSPQSQVRLYQALQELEPEIAEEFYNAFLASMETPYALRLGSLPRYLSRAVDFFNSFFVNSVKYLGPLRDDPKPLYPLAATADPADIGLRGEYTAAVLDLHKDNLIPYLPSTRFAKPEVETRPTTRSLEAAVWDWLQYMGIAEKVETRDRGKLGHELKVTTSELDRPQDLTHVGVGVSQVLPILVMCLLADEDTTLIIEQPELHLHPKVQTLLADFFLSMALLGKQCIIETHSEYIINRLRFRAASAVEDALSSIMKIYFVEKKDGVSSFRDVVVNRYGAITDWPEGFFDQSQREAEEILRAAVTKKKQERQQRRNNG